MPNHDSPLILLVALLLSLLLNAGGLPVIKYLMNHRPGHTELIPSSPHEDDEEEDLTDEEEEAEEPKFLPGIENGAPATVTWIGYDEYQEHLAELAEVEQAAFTMADGAPGQPVISVTTQESVMPQPTAEVPPTPPVEIAVETPAPAPAIAETIVAEASTADEAEATEENSAAPESVVSAPLEIDQPTAVDLQDEETILDTLLESELLTIPIEIDQAPESPDVEEIEKVDEPQTEVREESDPMAEAEMLNEDLPSVPVENEVEEIMKTETEAVPVDALDVQPVDPTPVTPPASGSKSNPSPDPRDSDLVPTDKESQATSLKRVPEIEWNSGKPLAIEGMEIKPYSLNRHIAIDSKDSLFKIRRWEGRVKQNPLVSLQFDRFGKVAKLRIVRNTGFSTFDVRFLESWLGRWTARDKRLADLKEDELTDPIVIKLIFIDEPKNAKESAGKTGK